MDYLHLIILGIVQGVTEFLPISSSAHLILMPEIAGWEDQGLANDIAAHLGSLVAVVVHFRTELITIISAPVRVMQGHTVQHEAKLFWYLIIATIPIAVAGYFLYDIAATLLRNPLVIAGATILFAGLLWWADVKGRRDRIQGDITRRDAILVGFAQVLAIIPGTSRAGITMTAGLMLGLNRQTAARFSFLMAVPVILLAGGHEVTQLVTGDGSTDPLAFLIVMTVSGISAWLSIKYFLALLEWTGMLPYVIYRLLLGSVLFYLFT
ncbi:MAG TPA: undecaprenyl-diphosphate phosphatase [Gammaproteobacteria bacterium]|nr:undecaprenyl-diphosphate phosphatase [Gammaproteobacteria bacterium]